MPLVGGCCVGKGALFLLFLPLTLLRHLSAPHDHMTLAPVLQCHSQCCSATARAAGRSAAQSHVLYSTEHMHSTEHLYSARSTTRPALWPGARACTSVGLPGQLICNNSDYSGLISGWQTWNCCKATRRAHCRSCARLQIVREASTDICLTLSNNSVVHPESLG